MHTAETDRLEEARGALDGAAAADEAGDEAQRPDHDEVDGRPHEVGAHVAQLVACGSEGGVRVV